MKTFDTYEAALAGCAPVRRGSSGAPAVGLVTADSREVVSGTIFVAVPGTAADGHDFIAAAVTRGAAAVVHQRELAAYEPGVVYWQVANPRRAFALLTRAFFDAPDRRLELFGVTGTNGKTTTAFLVRQLLDRSGMPCGLLSTIEYRTPRRTMPATHTTPDSKTFYATLAAIAADGGRAAAMELSSHSLDQHRTDGVTFRAAVFTNLTGDHLDYHGDMEHYFQAKVRLFTELVAADGVAIVNVDDPYGRRLAAMLKDQALTFGRSGDAMARIGEAKLNARRTTFSLSYRGATHRVVAPLIGEHNIYNLTGALLGAAAFGIDFAALVGQAAGIDPIPGRLELVNTPEGSLCYVDYAHTDDALEKVLRTLRPLCRGRLVVVFGCGGDRDRTKRPRMGSVAAQLADFAIVTSDNPRGEVPEAIIAEIVAGIPENHAFQVEPDRHLAIRLARRLARPGDIVLIAGKGHEKYQEIQKQKYPFDDCEEAGAVLPVVEQAERERT
jgi:UDP-N-acetylmuramoyl-L-alanyl-D-glutamate--2,6-diaminopimelate ligase